MFKKLQAGLEVAAQKGTKMLNNAMGIESTIDEAFENERRKFDSYCKSIDDMATHLKNQSIGLNGLLDSLRKFSNDLILFSGEDNRIQTAESAQRTIESLASQIEAHSLVAKQMEINMKSVYDNLIVLKKEIQERDRLLMEYDKSKHEVSKESQKQPPSQQIPILQQRVDSCRSLFEKRNEDTIIQISNSYRTRNIHTDYQAVMSSYANLFGAAGQAFGRLSQDIQAHGPPSVPVLSPRAPTPSAAASNPASGPPPVARRTVPPPQAGPPQVRALYQFKSEAASELSFNAGDVITIVNDTHPEWWIGSLNGRSGEFPSNYVQKI